ncbi:MAG: rhodanese-like domain-containing protein [Bellilinea sp.]
MANRKSRKNLAPWILMIGGSLIILTVVIWQTTKVLTPVETSTAPVNSPSNSYIPYPDVERISLMDAKTAFDNGAALFIDVRDPEYYDVLHISGALNIPYSQLETRMKELAVNQHIITYCT